MACAVAVVVVAEAGAVAVVVVAEAGAACKAAAAAVACEAVVAAAATAEEDRPPERYNELARAHDGVTRATPFPV